MRSLILNLLLFLILFETAKAQHNEVNYSTKNTKQIHNLFTYIDNFEWFEYSDDYLMFVYDSMGIINYNHSDTNNIWQVCHPTKGDWTNGALQLYPDTFSSKVLLTDSIDPYPINNLSTIDLYIVKPAWTSFYNFCWSKLNFSFFFKCETDTLTDGLFVEISFNGGQTFVNAQDSFAVVSTANGPQQFAMTQYLNDMRLNNDYGISGYINYGETLGWKTFNIEMAWDDLHGFDVDEAIIKINFISDSIQTNKRGVIIDYLYIKVEDWCNIISVNNIDLKYLCKVYPNPINEYSVLSFSNPECKKFKLEIVDNNGKLIFENETSNQQFNIGELYLPKGVYYYRLSNEFGEVKTGSFIKNRLDL